MEKTGLDPNYFMVSTGISNHNFTKLQKIVNNINVKFICIDIANGYMEKLVAFCKKVRETFPDQDNCSW